MIDSRTTFDCHGQYGKYRFTCWRKSGHGSLTAAQAFAQSCNISFATIAKMLTATQIESYAQQLGLAQKVGWRDQQLVPLLEEQKGLIFSAQTDRHDEGVQIQTAIGQRDVLMTPLQAANMMVTLLHEGTRFAPRILKEIRYQTNTLKTRFKPQVVNQANEKLATASVELRHWMRLTVTEGTAHTLHDAKWPIAGKTGTAQVNIRGQERVHQWFVGYGPEWIDKVDSAALQSQASPKYTIAIVAENMEPDATNRVLPLTKSIMNFLSNYEVEQAR
jgi:cell division protein FtsI/penicillin-binding protein 2